MRYLLILLLSLSAFAKLSVETFNTGLAHGFVNDAKIKSFSKLSTLNNRQVIEAHVDYKGENVKVLCTHIAADLNAPYTGTSASWAQENLEQVQELISMSNEKLMRK
jgi:hypothetical protein